MPKATDNTTKAAETTAAETTTTDEKAIAAAAPSQVSIGGGLDAFSQFRSKGPIVGMEDLSAEDIKMPKIKLCQPTSAEVTDEKAKQGQFLNVTTGEAYDELPCQILSFGKSRVRWPEVFKRGEDPLCRSLDNTVSDTDGTLCATCDYRVWHENKRPDCGQVYVFLLLLPNGSPARYMISGAQISRCKDFLTEVGRNGLPVFIYKMKLTSEKQKNEKGTYYVTNFTMEKNEDGSYALIDVKNYDYYRNLTESLKSMFNKVRATDLVSSDTAEAHGDDGEKGIF